MNTETNFIARRYITSSKTAHIEAAEWLAQYGITSKPFDWYEQRGFSQIGSGIRNQYWATPDNDIIIHQRFEASGALRVLTLYENKAAYNEAVNEWRKLTDKDPETGRYRYR